MDNTQNSSGERLVLLESQATNGLEGKVVHIDREHRVAKELKTRIKEITFQKIKNLETFI